MTAGTTMSACALAACACACGGDDAAPGSDGGALACTGAADCDDGVFCNGAERCEDGACASAIGGPCPAQVCSEDADACSIECDVSGDADGDASDAPECGGDDCDDANPLRFPGAIEVCDVGDVDEDCDPSTFGDRDADGDDWVDVRCCNDGPDGRACGDDCDDMHPGVHPSEAEECDELDNAARLGRWWVHMTATTRPDRAARRARACPRSATAPTTTATA